MLTVNHLTKLLRIAILAAITYLLTLLAVPVVPIAPYLKLDLSDLPILVGTVMLGMGSGISIAALAVLLHLLTNGFALPTMLGDAVMLVAAVIMVVTLGGLRHLLSPRPSKSHKVLLIVIITVNLTVAMAIINLWAIPLEMKMLGMTINLPIVKLVIFGVVPFNLIKGILISILFLVMDRYFQKSNRWN